MKRVGFAILASVVAAMVLAPFGLGLKQQGVQVTAQVAVAVNQCSNGVAPDTKGNCPSGSVVNAKGCVNIALPVIGTDTCINNDKKNGSAIVNYLKLLLSVLSKLVGAVIILMLVIAGIQYITSMGDPGAIKNAKNRITNAITALVLFLMMYAILNFLVPGGIL